MKKKNYFLLVLATMAFAACTSDDIITDGGHEIVDNETAWISLGVRKASTRSLNDPKQHNGTPDESNIETIKLLFFNGHTDASVVTNEVDFATADLGEVTTNPKAFKVSKSAKAILIIANPANLPVISVGSSTYGYINAAVANTTVESVMGMGVVDKKDAFMMTNAKGGLEPSVAGTGANADLMLHPTATAAESAALTLFIDRVAAKVRVDASGATSPVATLSEIGWTLNVINKKYFPVSKRIKSYFNTGTPYDIFGLGSYRIDPNYNNSLVPWGDAGYSDEYYYFSEANVPASAVWKSAGTAVGNDPTYNGPDVEYCLENTHREEDNVHAYSTQVLLKAKFTPNAYQLPDKTTSNTQETNGDWMFIKGGYYTYTTLLEWIEDEMVAKYTDKDPDVFETELTTIFNAYLVAIGETAITFPTKAEFDAGADDAATVAANIKAAFAEPTLKAAVVAKGAFSDGTVNYYKNALNYYKIMIKHDDRDTELNKHGEFGVVRNSIYDIIIAKFNNPGYPTIPDPDPNTPDEAESWLALKIEVNPWTWYKQVEEL